MTRKHVIVTILGTILLVANLPAITAILIDAGLVGLARHTRSEFLTGTAIAVILALLVLMPGYRILRPHPETLTRSCTVCDNSLGEHARYCSRCGSRVTLPASRKPRQLQRLRQER